MQMSQPTNLAWYSTVLVSVCDRVLEDMKGVPCQSAENAGIGAVVVHVLECSSRSRFSKVDKLITAVGAADNHESSTADATVVHADHTNTEDGADELQMMLFGARIFQDVMNLPHLRHFLPY